MIGHASAGVADGGAVFARAAAGERPDHRSALAEPLQLDTRGVDAEVALDGFDDRVDVEEAGSCGPEPTDSLGGHEDGAATRQRGEPKEPWLPATSLALPVAP
jgi:hypothetical protein